MPRLYRPHVPLEVRCRVALRQLGEFWLDDVVSESRGSLRVLLDAQLARLAALLGCEARDLHLDHDPPLAARPRFIKGLRVCYEPDANSADHLIYREKRAHQIKTNVRGEHGQHPDRVLIKKEKRRQNPAKPSRKTAWPKRKLQSASWWPKGRKISTRRKP